MPFDTNNPEDLKRLSSFQRARIENRDRRKAEGRDKISAPIEKLDQAARAYAQSIADTKTLSEAERIETPSPGPARGSQERIRRTVESATQRRRRRDVQLRILSACNEARRTGRDLREVLVEFRLEEHLPAIEEIAELVEFGPTTEPTKDD